MADRILGSEHAPSKLVLDTNRKDESRHLLDAGGTGHGARFNPWKAAGLPNFAVPERLRLCLLH